MGLLRSAKDILIENTAPRILNETLMVDYGKITSLQVNSAAKQLHIEALLRGEKEPIRVEIDSYEIEQRNGHPHLKIKQISTSREWITTLARKQLVGRPIALPKQFSALLGRLL